MLGQGGAVAECADVAKAFDIVAISGRGQDKTGAGGAEYGSGAVIWGAEKPHVSGDSRLR